MQVDRIKNAGRPLTITLRRVSLLSGQCDSRNNGVGSDSSAGTLGQNPTSSLSSCRHNSVATSAEYGAKVPEHVEQGLPELLSAAAANGPEFVEALFRVCSEYVEQGQLAVGGCTRPYNENTQVNGARDCGVDALEEQLRVSRSQIRTLELRLQDRDREISTLRAQLQQSSSQALDTDSIQMPTWDATETLVWFGSTFPFSDL